MKRSEINQKEIRPSKVTYKFAMFPTDEKFSLLPALFGAIIGITAKWMAQKNWFSDTPGKTEAILDNVLRNSLLKISGVCLKFKNKTSAPS